MIFNDADACNAIENILIIHKSCLLEQLIHEHSKT